MRKGTEITVFWCLLFVCIFCNGFPVHFCGKQNWIFPATLVIWDTNVASVCGRIGKTHFKKNQPVGFFCFFLYIFAQKIEFLGFLSFMSYLFIKNLFQRKKSLLFLYKKFKI